MRAIIEEHIDANYEQLTEAFKTLGKAEMPDIFPQTVTALRKLIASEYGVDTVGAEELQGPLIQKISQELGDPDIEVTKWILEHEYAARHPQPDSAMRSAPDGRCAASQ